MLCVTLVAQVPVQLELVVRRSEPLTVRFVCVAILSLQAFWLGCRVLNPWTWGDNVNTSGVLHVAFAWMGLVCVLELLLHLALGWTMPTYWHVYVWPRAYLCAVCAFYSCASKN